jgi:hypothetical protein
MIMSCLMLSSALLCPFSERKYDVISVHMIQSSILEKTLYVQGHTGRGAPSANILIALGFSTDSILITSKRDFTITKK